MTGGTGFIGSAVARHIINDTPDHVRVVDKLPYAGNPEIFASIAKLNRFMASRMRKGFLILAKSISEHEALRADIAHGFKRANVEFFCTNAATPTILATFFD